MMMMILVKMVIYKSFTYTFEDFNEMNQCIVRLSAAGQISDTLDDELGIFCDVS